MLIFRGNDVQVGTKPTGSSGSHLVQIVTTNNTTQYEITDSSYTNSQQVGVNITPVYSDSVLHVEVSACVNLYGGNNVNQIGVVGLYENNVGTIRAQTRVGSTNDAASRDQYSQCYLQYLGSSGTAGAAQTFGLAIRRYANAYDNGVRIGQDSFPTIVTISEYGV